jgi:hypothetical protein
LRITVGPYGLEKRREIRQRRRAVEIGVAVAAAELECGRRGAPMTGAGSAFVEQERLHMPRELGHEVGGHLGRIRRQGCRETEREP